MAEGRTYIVRIRREKGELEGTLEHARGARVKSKSLAELEEIFRRIVLAQFGDGEPAFEFIDVASVPGGDWVILSPNGVVDTVAMSEADLYEGGICEICRSARGARTKIVRTVNASGARDAVLLVRGRASLRGGTAVDDAFLSALTATERGNLAVLPLALSGTSRRTLWEITASASIETVMVHGRQASGWRCTGCGSAAFGYFGAPVSAYVLASQLAGAASQVVAVQNSIHGPRIAVTRARWQELLAKGIKCVSSPLGLAGDDEAVPTEAMNLPLRPHVA